MKKYLLAFGLIAGILIIAVFTGCNCTTSSVNPDDLQQTTTGSTGIGTAVR